MTIGYLITCEHASNKIPAQYVALFKNQKTLLETHRGWDIGAIDCYQALCKTLPCISQKAKWSRLLIELNRSLGHPRLFSSITKTLDKTEQSQIIEQYYYPYRENIIKKIEFLLNDHTRILHISVHSFTPILNNIDRNADIGLLYDPQRERERNFCYQLKHQINKNCPEFRIRMNYPYRGNSDGLTTSLRKQFPSKVYLGIELEVNQKHFFNAQKKRNVIHSITAALKQILNNV